MGEQFTLTLTCSVLDTAQVRAVTDLNRLEPAALDVAPFEVVGGTRHRDIEAPPWRYFQYSYQLRLLGDEYFGQDVDIPSIAITYNLESSGVTGTRGRDQVYLLPTLPVRVLSLVPRAATDIEDGSPETFADIDRRTFRATGELAAAGVLFAFAAVLAGVALVRIARPHIARVAADSRMLPAAPVLRGCLREAARVKSEVERGGWTAGLIGRALSVFRIAGTVALGRPLAQRVVDVSATAEYAGRPLTGRSDQEGQLTLRRRRLSTKRALVSGAATAAALSARLADHDGGPVDPRMRTTLEELSESLGVLEPARYSRNEDFEASALDTALDTGTRAIQRLYAMNQWPARTAGKVSRRAARLKDALWSR